MRNTVLLGAVAVALVVSGCARRTPPPEAIGPVETAPVGPGGEVEIVTAATFAPDITREGPAADVLAELLA